MIGDCERGLYKGGKWGCKQKELCVGRMDWSMKGENQKLCFLGGKRNVGLEKYLEIKDGDFRYNFQ